jgi:hypothetical protein
MASSGHRNACSAARGSVVEDPADEIESLDTVVLGAYEQQPREIRMAVEVTKDRGGGVRSRSKRNRVWATPAATSPVLRPAAVSAHPIR